MRASLSNSFKRFDGDDRAEKQERPEPKPVDRSPGFPAEAAARRVRGKGVSAKNLSANPDLAPPQKKPAFYAYHDLTALREGRHVPVDFATTPTVTVRDQRQFAGTGDADDADPAIPLVAGFRAAKAVALVADWLPWQPQEYPPKPARFSVRTPGLVLRDPVLVKLRDGSVQPVPAPGTEGGSSVFPRLSLCDFPLALVERTEVELAPSRSTTWSRSGEFRPLDEMGA